MRPRCLGQQYAAILGNGLSGNIGEVDPNCLLGGIAGLGNVLHYPSEHLALLLVGSSAPDICSNPYLIRWRRATGDVVTASGNVVEDDLDQVAWRAGHLMMDRGERRAISAFWSDVSRPVAALQT
jgi:hypothetical protein